MTRLLPRPTRDAQADFDLAVMRRRTRRNQELLRAVRAEILAAYRAYENVEGRPSALSSISINIETSDALQGNYALTLPDGPLSDLRDELLSVVVPRRICPMCSRGIATTLDHYLPKNRYPEFSILPMNLVPACEWCNRNKLTLVGSDETGRFFHAYFDDLPDDDPLFTARVVVDETVVVDFFVNTGLARESYLNASYQFEALKLGELYSTSSSIELFESRFLLAELHATGGEQGLASALARSAGRFERSMGIHYWKTALYRELSESPDFCSVGFRLVEGG